MKPNTHQISKLSVGRRHLAAYCSRWPIAVAALFFVAAATVHAECNVLANPSWDPTTPANTDGARCWTYSFRDSTNRAYQLNDQWYAGHTPTTLTNKGFLKVESDGLTAGDFQYAASPWYAANPGNTWSSSAWFRHYNNLKGTQQGLLKITIVDSSFTVITNQEVAVLTTNSPDGWTLGRVSIVAPTNAAYVRLEAGLYNPDGGNSWGNVLVDDASLSSPNQFLANPGWDPSSYFNFTNDNGGRNWSYSAYVSSSEYALYSKDIYYAGRNPVTDGALGYVKCAIDGTISNDFRGVISPWFLAAPGNTWVASVFCHNESGSLKGTQVGIVTIEYADLATNILATVTNTVVSTNDSNWQLGSVSLAAPANTIYVRMKAGIYQPTTNAAGHVILDDASLTTTNQLLANPGFDPITPAGSDNGRGWTSTDIALGELINETWGIGRIGVGDWSRGLLKCTVDGTVAPDFQGATSDWSPATAGVTYQAAIFGGVPTSALAGNQQGIIVMEFADSATNVLGSFTNAVLDSSSPVGYFQYQVGSLVQVAPANTALARVKAGLYAPDFDGSGVILLDDASLMPVVIPQPVLNIAPGAGGTLVITWSGGGTLYQNTNLVGGAWVPVSGNPSGFYQFTPSETQMFFELQ